MLRDMQEASMNNTRTVIDTLIYDSPLEDLEKKLERRRGDNVEKVVEHFGVTRGGIQDEGHRAALPTKVW